MRRLLGYAGKTLRVDLSSMKIKAEALNKDDAGKFIGGTGLAAKIIHDEVDADASPLGARNKLVFMTGPLTGTITPCSGRHAVCAKSPLTGAWGEAHAAGFWGRELKKAGYDGIIVEGVAERPVYLWIHDGEVEIRGAEALWRRGSLETGEAIKRELGDEDIKALSIGPAGERLVRFACILSDVGRVAGRCGMGAVMGSKMLKAIAIKGTGDIAVSDFERLRSVLRRIYPLIMSFPTTQIQASYGTSGEVEAFHEYGDMPIRHFTIGAWDGIANLSGETYNRAIVKAHRACWNCPIACWRYVKVENGPFAGLEMRRGPEYESIASLGSLLLNDSIEVVAKANALCNYYGMDTISTGVTLGFAMECFERGLITKNETGGLELRWGDAGTIFKLIEVIGEREGFGDILAEGVKRASMKIGRGTERFAMHVKGLEIPMHDPRAFKGLGLQYATSNRGACHLQGNVFRIEQGERMTDLKIYDRFDRFDTKGKGRIVAIMQDWNEVLDSLIICKFMNIPPGHVSGLYSLTTGVVTHLPELMEAGERIYNVKRLFNVRCGIGREDDALPNRFLREPLPDGGARDQVVELDKMLAEYYEFRGWDERGVPTSERLKRLGLA